MVRGQCAAILFLAGVLMVYSACGPAGEKVVSVNLVLPADWESVIDMDALGAASSTPYIGTIRFLMGGAQGRYEDFPWSGHSASLDAGGAEDITVQAITAGQVIMEGHLPRPVSGSVQVTVALEKANGFSEAGSLLFPRQNHSAVLVSGVVYFMGGNTGTGVIEAVASSAGSFLSSAYAASLTYPRGETTVLHDSIGDQLFVFKGASDVEDNLYEIVDLENEIVVPRILYNSRFNFYAVKDNRGILLIGGDDGVSTWFENTLIINAQTLNEQLWTGLGTSIIRENPQCLSDWFKLSCFGGGSELIEVFDLTLGGIDYSLPFFSDLVGFTSTLLDNSNIIIIGGLEGLTTYNDVRLFEPYTGKYSELGPGIIFQRYLHTATKISNNEILVIGGGPTVETSHTAEILDLTTGESTLLPWRMKVPRVGHTATLLPDGRVLVTGGSATDRRMEVWNPRLPR